MDSFTIGRVEVRKAEVSDIDIIRNLQLSYDNQIEITKLTRMSYKEYLTWHVFNSLDSTYLLYIDGTFTAILGLGEGYNLFFLTSNNLMKYKKEAIRYFNKVLDFLLITEGSTKCKVFIDYDYTASIKWACKHGFKFKTLIELDKETKFGVYEYKLQKDKLSL